MTSQESCPELALLERFLLGLVSGADAETLEAHLVVCDACTRSLSAVVADDPLVAAVRESPGVPDLTQDEALQAHVPLFKCLQPREGTITWTVDGSPTEVNGTRGLYSFLGPATTADDLGSLGGYRILDVLGVGGMGIVFRAHDQRLNRDLAVKVIKPGLQTRADSVERFLHEARAAAAVTHDNIVPVYQADEQQGIPYLAMPLLRGESLESRIQRIGGPLPIEEILHIGRETAQGLAAAHARDLIHRDIKPANLWLEKTEADEFGRVKILDFGLAEMGNTGERVVGGTPGFMAPEQIRAEAVDARADLFSLGVVLYRLATGAMPFGGGSAVERMQNTLLRTPAPAQRLNPALSGDLSRLIGRMLAPRRDDRPASALEVAAQLEQLHQRLQEARRPWWSRRALLLAGGAGLAVGLGLWAWMGRPPLPEPVKPVEVTLDFTEPEARFELVQGERVRAIDLSKERSLLLEPGDYFIRPVGNTARKIRPDRFTVKPGEPFRVNLALTGEIRQHALHGGNVTGLALIESPEELLVLTSGVDRKVIEWKLRPVQKPDEQPVAFTPRYWSEPQRRVFPPLLCLAVSPDGSKVAFAGGDPEVNDSTVMIWDCRSRTQVQTIPGGLGMTRAVTFDDTGKILFYADSLGGIVATELATKKPLSGYCLPEERRALGIRHLAFDPAGALMLAAGGDGSVQVLRFIGAVRLNRDLTDAHPGGTEAVAFLPGEKGFVSAGRDGKIRIWDRKEFTFRELKGHEKAIHCVAVSADGSRLLSGDATGQIRLWSVATGETLFVLEGHRGRVNAVALTAEGMQALSAGEDRTVRFWQLPRR